MRLDEIRLQDHGRVDGEHQAFLFFNSPLMVIHRESVFERIKGNGTALVLGGDIPLYEGMPTTSQIVGELAASCGYPDGFPKSLAEVAEYFSELRSKPQLIDEFVRLVGGVPGKSSLMSMIAAVTSIKEIFTTTMDDLLQQFFGGQDLIVVRSDTDVSRIFAHERHLYRLNGTVAHGPSLRLTKSDVIAQLSQGTRSALVAQLAANIGSRQFLIIGHEMREWNFSFYFHEVTQQLGEFREKAILFCDNPDPVLVSYWNKKNVTVLAMDPLEFFGEYLEWEKKK